MRLCRYENWIEEGSLFPLLKACLRSFLHVPISTPGESQSLWLIVPPVGNPTMRKVHQAEILVAEHLHTSEELVK